MVVTGVHCEGFLECPLERLDNGLVVPAVDIEELQAYHRRATRTQIELATAADEWGYEFAVHPENHFDLTTECAPDPLFVQAAVAARTESLRLLQVANSVTRHDPVRLAERTALLDVVSEGRAEVGVATGAGRREAALFEADTETDTFDEYLDVVRAAWTESAVSHDGESYTVPPDVEWDHDQTYFYCAREESGVAPSELLRVENGVTKPAGLPVVPTPEQEPHPQVWRAAASPSAAREAARAGQNVCTFCGDVSAVAELVDAYHEAAANADWPDHRPAHDGDPFARGFDPDRWRGVAVQVPLFDTTVADEAALADWKLGQECLLTSKRSALPPEEADRIPVDAELFVAETDAPVVGDTDEIVATLHALRDACDAEDLAILPSVPVPGLSRADRRRQFRAFAERTVPELW